MGKSRLALTAAAQSNREVVFFLKKSLLPDIQSKMKKLGKIIKVPKINFISINASNVIDQLDRSLDLLNNTLDGKFIIVDEAHHFFNSIVNMSENALKLYRKIKEAKNIKILFLSGTPIVKSVFEIVPCFNMLAGLRDIAEEIEQSDIYQNNIA